MSTKHVAYLIEYTNVSDELISLVSGWTVEEVRDIRFDYIVQGRLEDELPRPASHRRAPWYTIVSKKFLLLSSQAIGKVRSRISAGR